MAISYAADNQLNAFMKENARRSAEGLPVVLILDSGLWYHSRHPNYFGCVSAKPGIQYIFLLCVLQARHLNWFTKCAQ